jgi:hypothetical protein
MMRLKVEEAGKSLHPNEVVVVIKTINGQERLVVSRRSIQNGSVQIGWPLGESDKAFLVELPRETQIGAWRVWVPKDQLIDVEERMRARFSQIEKFKLPYQGSRLSLIRLLKQRHTVRLGSKLN